MHGCKSGLSKGQKKKHAFKVHSRNKFLERYGTELTPQMERGIIDAIQSGKTELKKKTNAKRSVHNILTKDIDGLGNIKGIEYLTVVYDKKRKALITIW